VKTPYKPWLHTCALVLAICCLLTITFGAWESGQAWPLPGTDPARSVPMEPSEIATRIHLVLGILSGVLAVAIGVGSAKAESSAVRILGWFPLGLTVVAAALVSPSAMDAARPVVTLFHTLIAHLILASAAAVCVVTSRSWLAGPVLVDDTWKPSLRTLSLLVPGMVMLQILLGACYRRDLLGVMPHVLNAMLVLMLNLVVGVCLIKQFPAHPALRLSGLGLIVVTSCQVLLGFTAFVILLVSSAVTPALVTVGVIHAFTGSLTMAAATILSVQIRSNIRGARQTELAGMPA